MTQVYKVQLSMNQRHLVESGLTFKQGDFGFQIEIEVLDFDVTGVTPQIVFRKSIGAVESTTITVSGNKFTYTMRGTELDTPGPGICDLKLKNSTTQRISTASFRFFVEADTEDGLNQQANSYSDTIAQIAAGIEDYSKDAEAWANGTRDGSAIPSTDPAYNKNAKYYSEKVNKDVAEIENISNAGLYGAKGYASHIRDLTINTNNIYSSSGSGTHVLIPISPSDSITIKANSSLKTYYAILTALDEPVHAGTPSLSTVTGYTDCVELAKNGTATLTAPSDAVFLYLTNTISGSDFLPVKVEVNGINMLTGIKSKIDATQGEVDQLESELDDKVTMVAGANLYNPNAAGITEGKYLKNTGAETSNASYSISEYIEVTPGTTYYISDCVPSASTVCYAFYNSSKTFISADTMISGSATAPESARYIRLTVNKNNRYTTAQLRTEDNAEYVPFTYTNYPVFDLVATNYDPSATYLKNSIVSKDGLFLIAKQDITTAEAFTASHWKACRSLAEALQTLYGTSGGAKFGSNSISQSGTSVTADTKVSMTGKTNVAKNVIYQFCCTFSSFDKLTIGQGEQTVKYASWIEIDGTNLVVKRSGGGTSVATKTYAHGLTISDFLNVQIITDDAYQCNVKIQTNGAEYSTNESASFFGNCVGQFYFQSTTALTEYTYTVIFKDATKPIYLFGDSYMSFVTERWVYHLKEIGCFNSVLINACSGESSTGATQALSALNGSPLYALWALGMNDGSDSDSDTPDSTWLSGVGTFIEWSKQHGCTPILGTIPTVPQTGTLKNHEGKNNYIRSSGYRYIDFAKAVCPGGDGVWYTGMLNEDGVHPTEKGAIALYNRALADFPEIAGQLT